MAPTYVVPGLFSNRLAASSFEACTVLSKLSRWKKLLIGACINYNVIFKLNTIQIKFKNSFYHFFVSFVIFFAIDFEMGCCWWFVELASPKNEEKRCEFEKKCEDEAELAHISRIIQKTSVLKQKKRI